MLYEEVLNREALRMYLSKSYDSESVDGRYAMALKIVSGVIQKEPFSVQPGNNHVRPCHLFNLGRQRKGGLRKADLLEVLTVKVSYLSR